MAQSEILSLNQKCEQAKGEVVKLKQKSEQAEAFIKCSINKLIPISNEREVLLNKFTQMEIGITAARQQQEALLREIAAKLDSSIQQQEAVLYKLASSTQTPQQLDKVVSIETQLISTITAFLQQKQEREIPTPEKTSSNIDAATAVAADYRLPTSTSDKDLQPYVKLERISGEQYASI
ncbi:uncharacterized protein LOC123541152 [Mercenaria mercenaria]|uniref:uncharacterized protein LOC123541152 n=1 Tax=Mercenaria mercenaria TaxID=6596 RepID=UPI00234F2BA8|nr:uncharacterized protein LOC123541152 [Mercenaria mercenaria]